MEQEKKYYTFKVKAQSFFDLDELKIILQKKHNKPFTKVAVMEFLIETAKKELMK